MHRFYTDPFAVRDEGDLPDDLRGETDSEGRRTGVWRAAYPDGTPLAEVPYVDGHVDGTLRVHYPDGTEFRAEAWRAGRRDGMTTVHLEGGARHEVPFVAGQMDGVARIIGADGRVIEERPFAAGDHHGVLRRWDEQGRLRFEQGYEKGLQHGESVFRDERGEVEASREWFHGVPHGVSRWRGRPDDTFVHGVRVRGAFSWIDREGSPGGAPVVRMLVAAAALAALLLLGAGLVATLLALGLAIVVHEGGHLLAARRAGIPIAEFRVGFGPRVASFAVGPTVVDVRAIPLYGYVRPAAVRRSALPHVAAALRGARAPTTPVDAAEALVSAGEIAPTSRRIAYELGGISANVLSAYVVRWLAFMPADPLGAAGWVGSRLAWMFGAAAVALRDVFLPATYVRAEPGLLAAGQEHVRGAADALHMFVFISLFLAAFNLLPIPPLDGFRVAASAAVGTFGSDRAERVLRPLRIVGVVFFGVLVLGSLWFMGKDLFHIATR